MRLLGWALQVLILAAGLYLFLRFLRTTRGSRLVRGLLITSLGGVLGLWTLSKALDLEELSHIIQSGAGFAVVVLAIVFQPELRRAVAQIGGRTVAGRMDDRVDDAVREVVRAVTAMAARNHGALIAFEREGSLKSYAESGVALDSNVSRRLLEGIFHPGAAMHDGAVIVRDERVVAAGCILPLPEARGKRSDQGTRHRAALGLTEETDAVVVIVSEETGALSICENGRLKFDVTPEQLEERLRAALALSDPTTEPSFARVFLGGARNDVGWIAGSFVAAGAILWFAHQDISVTQELTVRVVGVSGDPTRQPTAGEILVRLPDTSHRVAAVEPVGAAGVLVTGTRSQIDELGGALGGVIDVGEPTEGTRSVQLDDVVWQAQVLGLRYAWKDERTPNIRVERIDSRSFSLAAAHITIEASELDPHYEARVDGVRFEPSSIEIVGPASLLPRLDDDLPLELEAVRLARGDRRERRQRVRLTSGLRRMGLDLSGLDSIEVAVPIVPARRELGIVPREIAVVCFAPERAGELDRWDLPEHARTARFRVETSGLIPADADAGSPALRERSNAIRRFVEENLLVFVDVADLPADGSSRAARVRWTWRRDWRDSLDALLLESGTLSGEEALDVELESDDEVLLERRAEDEPDDESPGA